jgi:hypothetical protein
LGIARADNLRQSLGVASASGADKDLFFFARPAQMVFQSPEATAASATHDSRDVF